MEPDSVVTLQLEPGLQQDGRVRVTPTYFIDPAGSASASVTVTDTNTPTGGLSIVAFNRVITEGDYARFQIRSSTAVSQTTAVIVKFTNDTSGRNFITQTNLNRPSSITPSPDLIHVVNIPSGQKFVDFSVPTVDLPGNGISATITAALQTNADSTYSLASTYTSAVVSVINPNIPRVSFAIVTPTITEGGTAQVRFTLTTTNNNYQIPPEGIDIDFSVAQTGGNFLNFRGITGTGNQKINLTRLGSLNYTITTRPLTATSAGSISITLNEDRESPAQYTRAALVRYTETITVNDIGLAAPVLSLSATTSFRSPELIDSYNEGETWVVQVRINPPAPYPFTVWITGSQTGDILASGRYSSLHDVATGTSRFIVNGSTEDDMTDEPDGTLSIAIRTQEGYTVHPDDNVVNFTIKDNDPEPMVSFEYSSVFSDEAIGNMRFPVQLSGISDKDVTLNYTIEGGSTSGLATLDQDFTSPGTELVIAAGSTSNNILVPIIDGPSTSEPNESFTLKITSVTNGQLEGGASELVATGTITDNDNSTAKPVIRIDNPRISESITGGKMTFTVAISDEIMNESVDLTYTTSNGTADSGSDYTAISQSKVVFNPSGFTQYHDNGGYYQ